ncbi:hypothetical protein RIF29_34098 [Crotalaria pallida]|uniref:Cysteine-rich receptor-like protein kinase n=1 Tax=Crotalaria pallida TaxID=3830 RepID=A0AAN9HUH5_CROPI
MVKQDINLLELKAEEVGLDTIEEERIRNLNVSLWSMASNRDSILLQRSRLQWLKEGDANSRFFHLVIRNKKSRDELKAIRVGEFWVEGVTGIRQEGQWGVYSVKSAYEVLTAKWNEDEEVFEQDLVQ